MSGFTSGFFENTALTAQSQVLVVQPDLPAQRKDTAVQHAVLSSRMCPQDRCDGVQTLNTWLIRCYKPQTTLTCTTQKWDKTSTTCPLSCPTAFGGLDERQQSFGHVSSLVLKNKQKHFSTQLSLYCIITDHVKLRISIVDCLDVG